MRFSEFIILLLPSIAQGEVLSLTEANYSEKTAGKSVFIKFFAPWCGHCKAMAPAWEKLAEDWKDHPIGLVAEVDCTEERALCEDFEIQGYPTLFYGDPSAPEPYEGDRDYESMSDFATENISKRMCSVYDTEACSDEEKLVIASLESRTLEDLSTSLEEIEKMAEAKEEAFDEKVEEMQRAYEKVVADYNAEVEEIRRSSNYHLLRAVVNKKEDAVKTEL